MTFINKDKLFRDGLQIKRLDFPQPDDRILQIEIYSGSAIFNISSTLLVFCMIILAHLLIICPILCIFRSYLKGKCILLSKFLKNLFNFMIYIRFIIEAFLFMIICTVSEVYEWNTNHSGSLALSIILILILLCFYILVIVYILFFPLESRKLQELVNMTKKSSFTKIYNIIFLSHRSFIVVFLIWFEHLSLTTKTTAYMLAHMSFVAYVLLIRPFKCIENNIIETINLMILTLVSSLFIYYQTRNDNLDKHSDLLIYVVLGNCIIAIVIISISIIIKLCYKWFLKRTKKNAIEDKNKAKSKFLSYKL